MKNNWTLVFDDDELYWPVGMSEQEKDDLTLKMMLGLDDGPCDLDPPEGVSVDQFELDWKYHAGNALDPYPVMLADYLETYYDDELNGAGYQSGTVVGQIYDKYGQQVCYKVWTKDDPDDELGYFDYIPANKVFFHEPFGDSTNGLKAIGYEWHDDPNMKTGGFYKNEKTGDIIYARDYM